MDKEQYNLLPDDLKLDARLAITLDKLVYASLNLHLFIRGRWVTSGGNNITSKPWLPRKDPAILWGLIDGVAIKELRYSWKYNEWVAQCNDGRVVERRIKEEEALIAAYCMADLNGNWAKWLKDNKE